MPPRLFSAVRRLFTTQRRRVWAKGFFESVADMLGADRLEGSGGLYFRVAKAAADLTGSKHAIVVLPAAPGRLAVAGCHGYPTMGLDEDFSLDRGVIGKAFQTRLHQLVPDVGREDAYYQFEADTTITSELAVPILDEDRDSVEAVINVESPKMCFFSVDDVELLQNLGRLMLLYRGTLAERTAAMQVLWELPDEVMVIDKKFRPIWANGVKRRYGEQLRLGSFLPARRESERNLAALFSGHEWPDPLEGETCFEIIERREDRCEWCVCNRAMMSGQLVEGVVYNPPKLPFMVELSAAPLFSSSGSRGDRKTAGCVETARRVTMRQKVLGCARKLRDRPTEPKALESIVAILRDDLGYSRIRLYRIETNDQGSRLLGVRFVGKHETTQEEFSRIERSIPPELENVLVAADNADNVGLLCLTDDIQKPEKEMSFFFQRARVPREWLTRVFDPDGKLELARVNEIVTVPLFVGQQRRLLCLDWLHSEESGREFTNDDLQALTIYSRLACAALESVRQSELRSKLVVLGEATAGLAHTLARIVDLPGPAGNASGPAEIQLPSLTGPATYLNELLCMGADHLRNFVRGPVSELLATTFDAAASKVRSDDDIPPTGHVDKWAARLESALRDAGVAVRPAILAQLARVLPETEEVVETCVAAFKHVDEGQWSSILERLVRLVVALEFQETIARDLRSFSEAVTQAVRFPEGEGKERVDLNRVITAAIRALGLTASRAKVAIEDSLDSQPLYAEVRQGDLLVAWLALLDNAIYAAKTEESGPRVEVGTRRTDVEAIVSISNNGQNVRQDKVALLGNVQFTMKPGGNGVGLIIAYDLIEANDGKISHNYDEQSGITTFTTRLPLAPAGGQQP